MVPTDVLDVREESLHRRESSEFAVDATLIVRIDEAVKGDRAGAVVHVRPA